jgi:hypothetical protein
MVSLLFVTVFDQPMQGETQDIFHVFRVEMMNVPEILLTLK